MEHVPPAVLPATALWILLLALLLADEPLPRRLRSIAPEPPADGAYAPMCPFCGALYDTPRACWCGSDGHWF
ncbi:MAG TPA: hypothetical protein VGM69_22165 [Chloroflexota bacterium]